MTDALTLAAPRTSAHQAAQCRREAVPRLWPDRHLPGHAALVWLLISIFSAGPAGLPPNLSDLSGDAGRRRAGQAGNRNPAEMAKVTTIGYGKVLAKR